MSDDPANPFAGLDGEDGYRIERCEGPGVVALYLVFYRAARPVEVCAGPASEGQSWLLWQAVHPTDEVRGQAARLELLLTAVCRFLNTSGQWDEALRALNLLRCVAAGGLVFPDYYYARSRLAANDYEHLFVKRDDPMTAVLWEEGGEVGPPRPREDIEDEWRSSEEPSGEASPAGAVPAAPGLAALASLQHPVDPAHAPGAESGSAG